MDYRTENAKTTQVVNPAYRTLDGQVRKRLGSSAALCGVRRHPSRRSILTKCTPSSAVKPSSKSIPQSCKKKSPR